MKLLMFYFKEVKYKTGKKVLDNIEDINETKHFYNILMPFIHIEQKDAEDKSKSITKMIKHIKWLARKFNAKEILLHSFAHLSTSKASIQDSKEILDKAQERLEKVGYIVSQTPFGYTLNLQLTLDENPLARVFREF